MTGKFIIIRHGESEWNAKGVWTGTTNVHLTDKGRHDSRLMGETLRGLPIDVVYVSQQIRTSETLEQVLVGMDVDTPPPHHVTAALNERDYGVYTGLNKWEVKQQVGEEQFQAIRRGWDTPIPEGETLKQVYARAVPFYQKTILPQLLAGHNVMIVAHGNSIRSIMKYIESISDAEIGNLEMIFGTAVIYDVDAQGRMLHKEVKTTDITLPKA